MAYEQDVNQLFHQQMGRAPTAAEVAEYAPKLASGTSAETMAGWLSASPENQARHASASAPAASTTSTVTPPAGGSSTSWFAGLNNKYKTFLGRDMDDAGKASWFNLDANTNQTDAELEAQWMTGALAELAGRKTPQKSTTPQLPTQPWQSPTTWTVTPNQTVAGQIESIIAKDSPLMQQARTRALQRQNAGGTLNSSMAVSAADSAMYDAAMPIASADASMYGNAAQTNANTENAFSRDFNQWQREREMANFNLGANDWAADRGLAREIELRKAPNSESDAALQRGYINALTGARTDYAEKLAGISAKTDMSPELKKETLLNLRTTYNTMISNYSKLLGWDPDSWIIKVADAQTGETDTPATTGGTGSNSGSGSFDPVNGY